MTRRSIVLPWLVGLALATSGVAWGQFPGQYIPPTYVPETPEPPLADKSKAVDVPERLLPSITGPAAPRMAPLPAAPASLDPPAPMVTIHVSAPASASAGADVEYKIVVKNESQAPAHHVRVTNPIPEGTRFQKAEPRAEQTPVEPTPKLLTWKLGTLKPGESQTIRLTLRPDKDGLEAIDNVARVQFEHGQKVRTVLHRPQLTIRKITNQHALEKQPIACKLIVENTGAVEVVNVRVFDVLNDGLEFVNWQEKGLAREWTIPALGPKQKKEFSYEIIATRSGTLGSKIEAAGERGAHAEDNWQISVGPSPLTVKITGPKQVYLNDPATYQVQVQYNGLAALDNVVVAFSMAKGMKVVRATPGAKDFKDELQWAIPRLNPKETRTYTVAVQMTAAGTVPSFAQVLWRGPAQRDEVTTEFLGAVALHLDLRESNDPVRVGDKVRYTLTVTNRGTAVAKDVKLLVSFPVMNFSLDIDGSDGKPLETKQPGVPLQEIILPPVAPKEKVTKTVTLKATGAGRAVLHVEMESSELPAGNVTKEEPTTITE